MIFKWVRDPRYNPEITSGPEALNFLPVEVTSNLPTAEPEQEQSAVSGSIKIVLANEHSMEISGGFDSDAVVRLSQRR